MARDVDGVYELPAGNPVISDTVIESDWANTTLADVKNALTDSLSRTGRGNMEAQFKAAAGSAAEPGVSFINSPTAGMNYSSADNTLTFSINGAAIFTVNADAVVMNESCVLSEDATANMQAVTKQQLDAVGDAAVKKAGDMMTGDLVLQYEDPQFALIPLTDGAHLIFSSDSNADASRISHNYGAESSIDFSTAFIEVTVQGVAGGEIRLSAEHVLLWQDATQPMGVVTKQQMEANFTDRLNGYLVSGLHNYSFGSDIDTHSIYTTNSKWFVNGNNNGTLPAEFSGDGFILVSAYSTHIHQNITDSAGGVFNRYSTSSGAAWSAWERVVTQQQMDAAIAAAIAATP